MEPVKNGSESTENDSIENQPSDKTLPSITKEVPKSSILKNKDKNSEKPQSKADEKLQVNWKESKEENQKEKDQSKVSATIVFKKKEFKEMTQILEQRYQDFSHDKKCMHF